MGGTPNTFRADEEANVPEGHTIHRLARDHERWFRGERVAVSSPQGRFAGAVRVDGARFVGAEAYGKHLFHRFGGARFVHVHLGLFGRFLHHRTPPPEPRETVRMRLASGGHVIDLVGATTCELVTAAEVEAVVARLGPDPIRGDSDPEQGWRALQRRRVGIGRALMDQTVLAGVGNVYRAEVLHVHGLHPETPSRDVTHRQWDALWDTLRTWMRGAVDERRIVTVDPDEVCKPRSALTGKERTYVYRHDRCGRCDGPVRRWDLAGRWAYACEACQPPP